MFEVLNADWRLVEQPDGTYRLKSSDGKIDVSNITHKQLMSLSAIISETLRAKGS